MIAYDHYVAGSLTAVRYTFSQSGEGLKPHRHPPELLHNCVVLRGRVRLDVEGEPSRVGEAGEILDFDGTKLHSITALDDGTRVANFLLSPLSPEDREAFRHDSGTI